MNRWLTGVVAALLAAIVATPAAAQRMDAEIDCTPAGEDYVYQCTVHLTEGPERQPVEGAEFLIRADMPSMPMAHNVPPATAVPGDGTGVYEATLELEMHGTWALRLDISEPRRDVVVIVRDFDDGPDDGHGHGHDHSHGHDHGHGQDGED